MHVLLLKKCLLVPSAHCIQFSPSGSKLAYIAEHQANSAHQSTVGLNEFSDWTEAEYKKLLGYKTEQKVTKGEAEVLDTSDLKDTMSWVDAGAVTPVKNQG